MEAFFPVQKLKRKRIAQALCSMHLMFEQHWLIKSSSIHHYIRSMLKKKQRDTTSGTVKLTMFYSLRYFNYTDADVNH